MKVAEFKSRSLKHTVCETSGNLSLSKSGVAVLSLGLRKEHYEFSFFVSGKILAQLTKSHRRQLTHSKDNQFR